MGAGNKDKDSWLLRCHHWWRLGLVPDAALHHRRRYGVLCGGGPKLGWPNKPTGVGISFCALVIMIFKGKFPWWLGADWPIWIRWSWHLGMILLRRNWWACVARITGLDDMAWSAEGFYNHHYTSAYPNYLLSAAGKKIRYCHWHPCIARY